ncbi:hypothetical protein KMP13_05160 [Epibacterium ulvae]|uniref:hypothetical protein n=1 Tax=Epibacterium ulvae TaxID=1156985 RepID=UPI001BFCBE16|nr:hypothetical protein [Epibacterium ulvae]MBT8153288.1 hypothetical protein [Epibacterium ulvae]
MTTPKSFGRRLLALVVLSAALAGCSDSGVFSFASRSADLGRSLPRGLTEIRMGEDPVIIAAPEGFCFDQQTLERSDDGGFALLARCENVRPLTRHRLPFGRENHLDPAVISAVISGPLVAAQTPSVGALINASSPVRVFAEHPDSLMPMVRMQATTPGVPGTSTTQWRGAMALGNRVIALSLYAPDGSELLGPSGAQLLRDMARRSDIRSRDALPLATPTAALRPTARPTPVAVAATEVPYGPLRPRLRPGTPAPVTIAQAPRPEKVSRRWRIGDLFK